MTTLFDYSSQKNLDHLIEITTFVQWYVIWYLDTHQVEDWERKSIEDYLLSQKVFDV